VPALADAAAAKPKTQKTAPRRLLESLEGNLDIDILKQLRKFFYPHGPDDEAESLDYESFLQVFGEVLGEEALSQQQLKAMFMVSRDACAQTL
jgi:hypothetical protein